MSYLEDYAAAEARLERRARSLKRIALALFVLFIVSGSLYLWFKNYREEQRVTQFLETLQQGDYEAAYTFWGCKVSAPCPNYDYRNFLEDWGPESKIGKVQSFRLGRSREAGSGVSVDVRINDQPVVQLWVEKRDSTLGFAPLF